MNAGPDVVAAQPCAVCEARESRLFAEIDGWSYQQCSRCAFVFVVPMPAQDELNTLYQGDEKPGGSESDAAEQHPEAGAHDQGYPKARSRHRRALLRSLRLWPLLWHKRVIDVGCGGGFMAGAFQRFGADASGLDIDRQAIRYARARYPKCNFYCQSFEDFEVDRPYDFVYSSELIEHVARLDNYMDLIRRLTHAGSHVLITTPDLGSPRVPTPVTDWDVFGPPYHVQFFDRDNLALLFERAGFSEVRVYGDKKAGLKMLFRRCKST
ncbi:MAG: class I SAM-dependent methyltransferase [Gammaproteobacteria bacterium]